MTELNEAPKAETEPPPPRPYRCSACGRIIGRVEVRASVAWLLIGNWEIQGRANVPCSCGALTAWHYKRQARKKFHG